MREPKLHYIVDSKGKKLSVILSIKDYENLIERLEDLDDLLTMEKRKNEPSIP